MELLSFSQFILSETYMTFGPNMPQKYNKDLSKYRPQIVKILQQAYKDIKGYGGLGSGSPAEVKEINQDITDHITKVVRRGDTITAVAVYKAKRGRKTIGMGFNRAAGRTSKDDLIAILTDDKRKERSWAETSDKVTPLLKSLGFPSIPASLAPKLLGKHVTIMPDGIHYTRKIGDVIKQKTLQGFPKPE